MAMTGRGGSSGGAKRGGGGVARGGQGGRAAKDGSARKGANIGSGGQRRRSLEGKGPTPKAEDRSWHKTYRPPGVRVAPQRQAPMGRRDEDSPEMVVGRNSVLEGLRAKIPITALWLASGIDIDDKLTEALALARKRGLEIVEVSRGQLDRIATGSSHQGVALVVPPYEYAHPADLLDVPGDEAPLIAALDQVTDPRNLGAVIRSVAAFGGHGVVVPERRSAGMSAGAWKTSAGAAARVRVARAVNLTRALKDYQKAGLTVIGLAGDGDMSLDDIDFAHDAIVVVVGSEDEGLSRLVRETCDIIVSIPVSSAVESLNAGVAAGVFLAEIARQRRLAS